MTLLVYFGVLTEFGAASVKGPDSIDVAYNRELRSRPPFFGGLGGSAGEVDIFCLAKVLL